MKLTKKKIFTLTLLVVAIHFFLTSAIEYRITVQVLDQTSKIDKEIFDKIFKAPRNYPIEKLEEEAKELSQKSIEKSREIFGKWRIPTFIISLPITRFIEPPVNDFLKKRLAKFLSWDNFLSKDISGIRLRMEAILIVGVIYLANSFAFGLLVYVIMIIFNRKSKPNKRRKLTKNKLGRKSGRA